ncbi:MAG: DUF2232 domain-containing protein [Pseudolabrys sp.]|jgi:hypothetical protein
MMQIVLIGIGAGAAAALLFASVISGAWLSVVLFYLAPLPVMLAGLGWSHWAALIAALAGALMLGLAFGSYFFLAFLAGAGLPAWWLGYLALLARPAGNGPVNGGAPELEWYPPGQLATWAAALGALTVSIAVFNFGLDGASVRANLHHELAQLLHLETGGGTQAGTPAIKGVGNPKVLLDFLVEAVPPAAAVLSTLTYLVNLWLGGRIVDFSGRLKRPWPTISAMTYPRASAAALGIAVVLGFAPGLFGILASVVAAALLLAFGVLGFAVLHALSRTMQSRGFLLGGAYAAVMVFGWPLLIMCVLGLADMFLNLRGRAAARRGGPSAPT